MKFGCRALAVALVATALAHAGETLTGMPTVLDGDTLELHGTRIRLYGIDAPESAQLCSRNGAPWQCGQAAALALSDFINGATVECRPVDVDRHGRVVAICTKGKIEVNDWLARQGWALDYTRYSGGAYRRAEAEARAARRGLWVAEFEPPWQWRRRARR